MYTITILQSHKLKRFDKVNAVQTKVNQAEALLQNKENNSALVNAKQQLQNAVNQVLQLQE